MASAAASVARSLACSTAASPVASAAAAAGSWLARSATSAALLALAAETAVCSCFAFLSSCRQRHPLQAISAADGGSGNPRPAHSATLAALVGWAAKAAVCSLTAALSKRRLGTTSQPRSAAAQSGLPLNDVRDRAGPAATAGLGFAVHDACSRVN